MVNTVSLIYSNHRTEAIAISAAIMARHEAILLEEPVHPAFTSMLEQRLGIEEYLLEQDPAYPDFSLQLYQRLQLLHDQGKRFYQVEPFLDQLLAIHLFFADNHGPEELDSSSQRYRVYCAEKEATRRLLAFYQAFRRGSFSETVDSVIRFARADAARFRLRDQLRAQSILDLLPEQRSIYIEAGPMHLYLRHLLEQRLPPAWAMETVSVEELILQQLGIKGSVYGPGDELTLAFLFGQPLSRPRQELLAARSLIYSKIISKEESRESAARFPHLRDEQEVHQLVNTLSLAQCEQLFFQLRPLVTSDARKRVEAFCKKAQGGQAKKEEKG
ncbi:hypothetical protein [Desulfogranum mediterraneum]|uniref:hypothetical protein n=1 Tax=Desulfogranum mediterraneum TaxID=160661 RepID=UPI0004048ECD|nr:hypothetical protein [Desulfogranum mediterraneum]